MMRHRPRIRRRHVAPGLRPAVANWHQGSFRDPGVRWFDAYTPRPMADSERPNPPAPRADRVPVRPRSSRSDRSGFNLRWPLIVGGSILMGVAVVFATVDPARPGPGLAASSPTPRPASPGYLTSVPELRDRAMRAAAGEQPYSDAVADLLADAQRLVDHAPDPKQPLRIDDDGGAFEADGTAAYALALAYRIGGDERYGRAAARILLAWVEETAFVEDTCANSGSCDTTLMVSRLGAAFVFAGDLLEGTAFWAPADRARLADWLERVILPAASERTNNWGDAGTLLRVAITAYSGDQAGFDRALDHWRALMDLVEADGTIPEERRRFVDGLQYTQEALQYKVAVAEIAGRRGVDLWSYEGRRGGTLKGTIDTFARYWFDPASWPYDPAVKVPRPGPMWELAYAHWQEPAWVNIVTERRPFGDLGHSALRWTTLTNGIATSVVAGPGSSPTAAPTVPPGPVLAEPLLRLASVPSAGGVDVGIVWTVTGASEPSAIRVEGAIDGAAPAVLSASAPAGREIVVALPTDRPIRLRATVLDPSGSPTTWVDGPAIVIRIHDDTAPMMVLTGAWTAAGHAGYVGGTAASSKTAGAVATVTVDAYGVMVIGPVGSTRGRFSASIDGASGTEIDTYRSRFDPSEALVVGSWATAGSHTLRLEVLGSPTSRPTVGLDAIVAIEAAR